MSKEVDLFQIAREHIIMLETRLETLISESKEKDKQIEELNALLQLSKSLNMSNTPKVWITGPSRHKILEVLVNKTTDGAHPLQIDTKYYLAEVSVVAGEHNVKLGDEIHAIVFALSADFHKEAATDVFSETGEVRLCICDDLRARDWCIDEGVEWVTWNDSNRILESLSSTMWPNMIMKERSNETTKKRTQEKKEKSVEEELEDFSRLMSKVREVRDAAPNLSDFERRSRAAMAAEELMKALGIDDQSEDESED